MTQTAHVHKKVERVLDMLREAAGLEVGGTKKVVRYEDCDRPRRRRYSFAGSNRRGTTE